MSSSTVTPTSPAFLALAGERYVSLTTYRKTGEPVSTPVWIGRDGDALIVLTPETSGKVKRLRNDPRVEMRPCSRRGKVADGARPTPGQAEILTERAGVERLKGIIRDKYGLEFRIFSLIEPLLYRGRNDERVILRITPA